MDFNAISPVFLQNLQTFASANIKFKLFLNDIKLDVGEKIIYNLLCLFHLYTLFQNPTKYDMEQIFSTLSNAILDPDLTIHIADIFKNDLLKILYPFVYNEHKAMTDEIHLRICRALSTIVNIHPDAGR